MIKKLKRTKLAQRFKKTKLCQFMIASCGDWRYPFICFSWWLAKVLVPRRRVSVDGVSFTLPCNNWVTHFRWYLFKSKEPEVRHYINTYVKEGDVFFDIGANIGVFSVYAGKRYKDLSVYCFEPEYSNLHTLKENIIRNDLTDKLKIHSVAIGNFVGMSSLHLQDLTSGAAAHSENKEKIEKTEEGFQVVWSEGIVSVTLDYLCDQLRVVPNSMKIDTDGNEDKVLEGATDTLANDKLRSMGIEMPRDPDKEEYCSKILTKSGFYKAWSDMDKTRNQIWAKGSN